MFNATPSDIVAVSFIDGGNRTIQRKPTTWRKSEANLITEYIEYTSPWGDIRTHNVRGNMHCLLV
jgi:hypothetical protein